MPTLLNERLEWPQIAANADVRAAFRGTPLKTLLPSGRMLCRFITTESLRQGIRGNETFKSPWWMDWSSAVNMLVRQKGSAPPKAIIRARMAIPQAFSQELDSLVQIILTNPVYAWKGTARHQNDTALGVTYTGGGEQFYLPNLASDSTGMSSAVAYVHCFTSIDSLV